MPKNRAKGINYPINSPERLNIAAGKKKKERTYWLDKLAGGLEKTVFPSLPHPPPPQGRRKNENRVSSEEIHFTLDDRLFDGLMKLSTGSDIRLHILLLSAVTLLLAKYTGHTDIIIGTPILKSDQDTELINTVLVVRNRLQVGMGFKELVMQTRQILIEADQHRNYPLELLAQELDPAPKEAPKEDESPFFDVAVLLENIHDRAHLQPFKPFKPGMIFSFSREKNSIRGFILYSPEKYHSGMMEQISRHFCHLVGQVISDTGKNTGDIDLLLPEEKRRLLVDFNYPAERYPTDKTIHGLFEEQAGKSPDHIAVVEEGNTSLSYKELDDEAGKTAGWLHKNGVEPGSIVGIMVKRSVEMMTGLLGILKSGCAYLPINPKNPTARTEFMLKDCAVKMLLRQEDIRSEPGSSTFTPPVINDLTFNDLAYIIYTSGTTGKPRGVAVTHGNVSPLLHWGYEHLEIGAGDRAVQNLSYYFDWSVWEIFITLTSGGSLYMISEELLQNPLGEVEFIRRHDISVLHVTPTQFRYLADTGKPLHSLDYLCIGAEKLTGDLVRQGMKQTHVHCRIFNMYGPTEATIMAAVQEIDRDKLEYYSQLSSVPIGPPIANGPLLVLDRNMKLCPVGVTGELFIGGDGVAHGYLNRPELTSEKFIKSKRVGLECHFGMRNRATLMWVQGEHLPGRRGPRGANRIYTTGDAVRWLADGTVEFLGRRDQQVKIRGFRIELGEIEARLVAHEQVKSVVVTAREVGTGGVCLCAYVVPVDRGDGVDVEALRDYLSGRLPDYMVPTFFVELEGFPLNPNGKIDLGALPDPVTDPVAGLRKRFPVSLDGVERKLVETWSEVLGVGREQIGVGANFFHLGGHSLKVTELASRIRRAFGVNVPLGEIFASPHIRGLAAYIKNAAASKHIAVEPAEKREYYPLSSAQRRLYILQQMDSEGGTGYNIPSARQLEGDLDAATLTGVFRRLIQRHESLRTFFTRINDEPVQQITEDSGQFHITRERDIESFIRPFDLSQAPLLRVGLIEISERKHILLVDMHHIISDGLSMGVFIKDFTELYAGKDLPPLGLHYKDYSQWQSNRANSDHTAAQKNHWLKQFEGEPPVLNLPTDYPRPKVQGFSGGTLHFEMSREKTAALKSLAREQEVTLFMLLLSIYTVFLSQISGQQDIVVGTPVAGRRHADLDGMIGMFVNTLALRNYPVMEKTFGQFLKEVRDNTVKAFENQDYPYGDLVKQLDVGRDTGRNPLFDTMFSLQNIGVQSVEIPGLKITPYDYDNSTSKFDLTLTAAETNDGLRFNFEYSTRLFNAETIHRLIDFFKKTVSSVPGNPGIVISGIEVISGDEKKRVLFDFNNTEAAFPREKTIQQLFEARLKSRRDGIAVVGGRKGSDGNEGNHDEISLTYEELNRKSGLLAGELMARGVQPDTIVGLKMERSVQLLIGILGILKAGGTYLPIDPDYPRERINYILDDSGAKIVLPVPGGQAEAKAGGAVPSCRVGATDPAYVIYTSGSTGRPKGVMIEHRSVINFIKGMTDIIDFNESDSLLSLTTVSFDIFGLEVFLPLTKGFKVVIGGRQDQVDPKLALLKMEKENITIFQVTPSRLMLLLSSGKSLKALEHLRYLLVGGEVFPVPLLETLGEVTGGRIYNLYGPTETTIWSTVRELTGERRVSIGKPINNTRIYVLSGAGRPQPIGVTGALFIAGDGLGRGYLNRPELSRDCFVTDPFHRGRRMYMTGDLARRLPDGNIEFLGRGDHQVKIRGFRIEPGEIEKALLKHPAVKSCLVVAESSDEGPQNPRCREQKTVGVNRQYLCAYFAAEEGEEEPGATQLREFLLSEVPDYMIPSYFVPLKTFPLTANGKIDRKALPKPGGPRLKATGTYVAPKTNLEKIIAQTWQEVLKLDEVGVEDNFFELGGSSLDIILTGSKLKDELNREIPVVTLFTYSTVNSLARYLEREKGGNSGSETPLDRGRSIKKGKNRLIQSMRMRKK